MKRFLWSAFVVGAIGLTVGCFLDPLDVDQNRRPEVVLHGFLTPGAPVEVLLRSTTSPTEYYSFMDLDQFGIDGAVVRITENGTPYDLAPGTRRGSYNDPALIAKPGARYDVEVTFEEGQFADRRLTATTTVPEQVRHTDVIYHKSQPRPVLGATTIESFTFPKTLANPDSFPPVGDEYTPFSLVWDPAAGASGYTVVVSAEDTSGTSLMRKREYKDWADGELNDPAARQYVANSAWFVMKDSTNADIYWMMFHYEGPTNVVLFAADEAYWEYFWTKLVGAGQSGADADVGETQNVEGGLGVFGSYTADTIATHISNAWRPDMYRDGFLSDSQRARVERYEANRSP